MNKKTSRVKAKAAVNIVSTTAKLKLPPRVITIEETQVARYHAFEETAAGFAVPDSTGLNDRHFRFPLPGAIALPAVIYYRTRHTGKPRFTVRINNARLTDYTFVEGDEAERTWHEIIPANSPGGPTLRPDNNELTFFVRDGSVIFGDVVILYISNQTTVPILFPIPIVGPSIEPQPL
jgi:hypothetical protein